MSKKKTVDVMMTPQQTSDALAGMADFLGADAMRFRGEFLRCLASQVGWLKLFQCLGQGDNWLACVGNSVDFGGVFECVMSRLGADEVEF